MSTPGLSVASQVAGLAPSAGEAHVWRLDDRSDVAGVLAGYLGVADADVRTRRDARGKPELDEAHESDLRFSVAHGGGVVLLAVAGSRVGVDVEPVRARAGGWALVDAALAPSEKAGLPEVGLARARTFLGMWVRKEALLKAAGVGLSVEPSSVELLGTEILSLPPQLGSPDAWTLVDLAVPRCVAALAVESLTISVRLFGLDPAPGAP